MQKGLIFVFAKLVLLWKMGSVKMLTSANEVCAKRMPIVSIPLALTNATVEVASFPTDRTVLISTSVLAIDITATPTRCAPTLRALIIAFVKKATSVTDFSARKKANKRKEQNQDVQRKKKERPLLTVSLSSVVMALNVLSSREPSVGHCDSCTKRIVSTRLDCFKQTCRYSKVTFGQHFFFHGKESGLVSL